MVKKHFWRIEYSITIFVIFAVILFFIPAKFTASHEASYISYWNETFHKMEYVFSAMNAHADVDIIKGFKNAKDNETREKFMMYLVKPYLRLTEDNKLIKKYNPTFLNGEKIKENSDLYFDNLYLSENNHIVGIKDIKDEDIYHPAFIMMFDINGLNGPNKWGKDIFGINIFVDGKIAPLGAGQEINDLKDDCSEKGTGVFCSHYYRIGGDFKE